MKKWTVELTRGVRTLTEAEIQRGIFQGKALWQLQCIIAMMPLNHILCKCVNGYKFTKSLRKVNQLMYTDGNNLFVKNEELEIQIQRIYSQDIGMEFGVEKCAMP